jgi:PAS domain S-box-containing protein
MEVSLPASDQYIAHSENIFKTLVEESPYPVGLYVGRDMIIKLANQTMINVWGKSGDVIGKSYKDVLPELASQPIFDLLDSVYNTGVAYQASEDRVDLVINGVLTEHYFNFSFKPLKNEQGQVWGVLNTGADVTELVQTRKRLEDSENRISFALEAAELGTWDMDPVSQLIKLNDQCRGFYGIDKDDTIAYIDIINHTHPDDRERLMSAVNAAMDCRTTGEYEVEFRTADLRNPRWLRCRGKAYFDQNGVAYRFVGIAMDISKEVKAREEQLKLTTIVENSADLIGVTDLEGKVIYINKSGIDMMGFSSFEEACSPASEYFLPSEESILINEVNPSMVATGKWSGEIYYRHHLTGEGIPVFLNAFTLKDPLTNAPIGFASVTRDLRADKAARQALAKSEQLFRNITIASPAALWMTNNEMAITYVNQIWIDWTGKPLDYHLGTGWINAVIDEDRQIAADKLINDFKEQRFHESQFRISNTNTNELRWIICTGNPQYNNEGVFTGFIGACVDITELKQLQKQKDEFIGIASHELKTPVTSIKAYTQVLEAMLIKKGETKEAGMIAKMDMQINRLTSLIGDLLDVTKISSGRLQFNPSWFNFNTMIKEVLEELQRTTRSHTLIEDFQANVDVFADKDRIGQVITNLITNAIKYSPKADKIIISAKIEDGEVNVCVEDFGIGISEEKLGKVFEQFYRVSGDKQHTFPGLGLGLYIASEIVKRENGRIWVTSTEGKGSTFCFSLPVNRVIAN